MESISASSSFSSESAGVYEDVRIQGSMVESQSIQKDHNTRFTSYCLIFFGNLVLENPLELSSQVSGQTWVPEFLRNPLGVRSRPGKHLRCAFKTYLKTRGRTTREKAEERTFRETLLWKKLMRDHHPNINTFYGVFLVEHGNWRPVTSGVPTIVTELVDHEAIVYTQSLTPERRLDVMVQVLRGLQHLHKLEIVHGDMKPDNFRITCDGVAKIIDLGLGRDLECPRTGFTTTVEPTFQFIAPELIKGSEGRAVRTHVTKKTDIYAWSMTALQILDGRGSKSRPFNTVLLEDVRNAVSEGRWPERGAYGAVNPLVWDLIKTCWTLDPAIRPDAETLLENVQPLMT